MSLDSNISERITILVNTCDSYDDLWYPFFSLLNKYFELGEVEIVLNTESKNFSYKSLNIKCVHPATSMSYVERMKNAVNQVKTEYVILLLDDFFLRKKSDMSIIESIIKWMDQDNDIACFSADCNKTYVDFEVDKYFGFKRLPLGNDYTLNLQGAIWRTNILKKYLFPKVNPWEWEIFSNALTYNHPNHKFYELSGSIDPFLDYGHYRFGDKWGVYRGKWVKEDVIPFFESEGIKMDFNRRGFYDQDAYSVDVGGAFPKTHLEMRSKIYRCLGKRELLKYYSFVCYRFIRKIVGRKTIDNYFLYRKNKAIKRFMRKNDK